MNTNTNNTSIDCNVNGEVNMSKEVPHYNNTSEQINQQPLPSNNRFISAAAILNNVMPFYSTYKVTMFQQPFYQQNNIPPVYTPPSDMNASLKSSQDNNTGEMSNEQSQPQQQSLYNSQEQQLLYQPPPQHQPVYNSQDEQQSQQSQPQQPVYNSQQQPSLYQQQLYQQSLYGQQNQQISQAQQPIYNNFQQNQQIQQLCQLEQSIYDSETQAQENEEMKTPFDDYKEYMKVLNEKMKYKNHKHKSKKRVIMMDNKKYCVICGRKNPNNAIYLPECKDCYCRKCLSNYIERKGLGNGNFNCVYCKKEFVLDKWSVSEGIIYEDELDIIEENRENALKDSLIYCLNPNCPNLGEPFMFEAGEINNKVTGEKDNEGKEMSLEMIQHRDKYRIKCVHCGKDWCRNCKKMPYHLGKSCEEYEEYLKMKKCRYCNERLKESDDIELEVCENEECKNKQKISCNKRLECGHFCCGIKDEEKCLMCLNSECNGNKIEGEDYCTICYSEGLNQSPCIELKCGHIFHYNCVIEKIKNKWSGIRISFGYLECPQCRELMEHPSINEIIHPELKLLDTVKRACLSYLKVENMMNNKELTNPSSEFYNKPEEYGLKKFAFYLCDECHKPYYAGLAECGEPPADEIPKKLCSDCQFRGSNIQECPKHGKEFIQFKCRFCCNYSKWFCWNTTHFCEACHQKSTTLPKLPKDQLPKCPGKDKCPLGVDHPPNGEEYCLGCGLCRFENAGLT